MCSSIKIMQFILNNNLIVRDNKNQGKKHDAIDFRIVRCGFGFRAGWAFKMATESSFRTMTKRKCQNGGLLFVLKPKAGGNCKANIFIKVSFNFFNFIVNFILKFLTPSKKTVLCSKEGNVVVFHCFERERGL